MNRTTRRSPTNTVLDEERVAEIKRRLKGGDRPRDIAADEGVGVENIRRIGRGEIWGWVRAKK